MYNLNKDLVVVASKYFNVNQIKKLNQSGYGHFGENRVNDLLKKQKELTELSIKYHFIGHLQTNKVKQVINQIDYLHSLDSIKLAAEIQKHRQTEIKCFIQLNLLEDVNKFGILAEELASFLTEIKKYDKIKVVGLMTIGQQGNLDKTNNVFNQLNQLKIKHSLSGLSIGMSDDYLLALKYQPTFIRIGSLLKEELENGNI